MRRPRDLVGGGPGAPGGDDPDHEVRFLQPYQALKRYRCPGCSHEIPAGTAHLVVVPREDPDLRRHWHVPCWQARATRRPRPPSR